MAQLEGLRVAFLDDVQRGIVVHVFQSLQFINVVLMKRMDLVQFLVVEQPHILEFRQDSTDFWSA